MGCQQGYPVAAEWVLVVPTAGFHCAGLETKPTVCAIQSFVEADLGAATAKGVKVPQTSYCCFAGAVRHLQLLKGNCYRPDIQSIAFDICQVQQPVVRQEPHPVIKGHTQRLCLARG